MDPLNDSLVDALQYTFSYKINEKLNIWREAWAQHGMRTVHGTEGILDDEDDDNEGRPLMFPFSFEISEECRNDLSANVTQQWVSNNYGIVIYQKVLTIINRHHPSET
jgi:hypothetical protein